VLQARAEKAQASNTMLADLVIGPQSLLDGKKYAPGQAPPPFKASPFRGVDDRGTVIAAGQKERVRTLLSLTVMLRCVHSAELKAAAARGTHPRVFRVTDTLLTSVEFLDRLMSPAVLKRMRTMTEAAIETAKVGSEPLKSFLTDKLVDESWTFERRDLQIVSIYLADLLLHFDGHNLRRVLYTAYPRKCNIFTSECPSEAQDALWELKTRLLVQWVLESARSLKFDVVDASLLRRLERMGCLHRNRSFVLGLFKALESTPAQLVDLSRVEHHKDPLDWGFAATGADATRGLFDVDF
jgi:hypothetical protein